MDRLVKPVLLTLALTLCAGVTFGCKTVKGAAEGGEQDIEAVKDNFDGDD